MKRWLMKNQWPFAPDRNGFPKVLRSYFDARMSGDIVPPAKPTAQEPDFSEFGKLRAIKNGRS